MFDMVDGDIQALLQENASAEDVFSVMPSSSVVVHSLSGSHMRLLVRKKEEFKGEDLLQARRSCFVLCASACLCQHRNRMPRTCIPT